MAVLKWYESIRGQNPVGLLSAVLYGLAVFFGLVLAVPIGITLRNFDGVCVLFAEVVWNNRYIFPWSDESCDFVMYFAIAVSIFYATFMGAFTLFAVLPRTTEKADMIGVIQARHSTFILQSMNPVFHLINICITCLTLISAIVVTVGFAEFCNDLVESMTELGLDFNSCYQAQQLDWNLITVVGGGSNPRGQNFHICLTVALIAAWALFVIWLLQTALNFRYCCRGFSCGVAEEKQRASKSSSVALRRSRMATPIGTPGHMTPRSYGLPPPQQMGAYGGPVGHHQQVSHGPLPPKA